ncbi:MAG TPA: glycosyltransferase [Saprospiraceae bacterium]|nr:glycosyltransferase [Saprospiraceae bacterium]
MFPKIVLGIFIVSTIIQIAYWVVLFAGILRYRDKSMSQIFNPVTVILCAKDEAGNLKKNLPRILNQNYHLQNVIVVNDNSSDSSASVLLDIRTNHKTFTIVNAKNVSTEISGKKTALAQGIEKADTEVLLMTDADCVPTSDNWVRKMQQKITGPIEIVLGFSPYTKLKGWLNAFIRFDTLIIAIQYFSMSIAGMTYMGVGRNLAYKKSLYKRTGGFEKHMHILSGDDDLFIQEAANKNNVAINLDQESFMISEPKKTWKDFFIQKARHVTTGKTYKLSHSILLGLFVLTLILHYLGGIGLIAYQYFIQAVIVSMIIKLAITWGIFNKLAQVFKEGDLVKWFPILEMNFMIFNILLTPTLMTYKPTKWK